MLLKILSERRPGPPMLPKGRLLENVTIDMPSWLSEEDLDYYTASFEKTGFIGGLNYYRALDMYVTLYIDLLGLESLKSQFAVASRKSTDI